MLWSIEIRLQNPDTKLQFYLRPYISHASDRKSADYILWNEECESVRVSWNDTRLLVLLSASRLDKKLFKKNYTYSIVLIRIVDAAS